MPIPNSRHSDNRPISNRRQCDYINFAKSTARYAPVAPLVCVIITTQRLDQRMKRPASLLRTVVPRATLFLSVGSHFRTPSANLIYQRCIVASKPFATMAAATGAPLKTALIIGGNGALGQGVVNTFKNAGWSTISADVTYVFTGAGIHANTPISPTTSTSVVPPFSPVVRRVNAAADSCIALSTLDSWEKQVEHVKTQLIL